MNTLETKILELQKRFSKALEHATTASMAEAVRIEFLGRSGAIADLMNELKKLSLEEKKIYGPKLNAFKSEAQASFDAIIEKIHTQENAQANLRAAHFDVTAYKQRNKGSVHPYTKVIELIENVFISMGFAIADGPEVETDYHNFKALNIPDDHPARDMHDTFWLNVPGMLMRTHTSPVQVRTMENQKPPIAIIASGRTYRHEATDATHDFMFMQTEGLVIDKGISMAHLLATTKLFLQTVFDKKNLNIRVRPGFFPFTEPGVEIDMTCPFCKKGCSVCKKTTWVEIMGAGLVHPNVLRMSKIDPQIYSGFAFGFGLTRLTMLKYGINDIRLLHSNKLDFLTQW